MCFVFVVCCSHGPGKDEIIDVYEQMGESKLVSAIVQTIIIFSVLFIIFTVMNYDYCVIEI